MAELLAHVVLELETDGDPIRGWISSAAERRHSFYGWLELAHELERARRLEQPADADQPRSPALSA